MTPKATTLLKVLLNRYHKGSLDEAMRFLPPDEAGVLKKNPTESQDLGPAAAQAQDLIKMVHYSWLKPFLSTRQKSLIPLFLSSLPKEQSSKLSLAFQVAPAEGIAPPLKCFLLQQMHKSVFDPHVLLPPYLPSSPLNALAGFSKPELLTLIDYFGLFDLAESIRQTVDKRIIKQVYSCLTPKKQEFLRQTLYQRERLTSTQIDLNQWRGDCRELKHTIHLRGVLRLGIALSDQHPDLIWLISHILDTGRAAILSEALRKEKNLGVASALAGQLINLMNFLKPKSHHEP